MRSALVLLTTSLIATGLVGCSKRYYTNLPDGRGRILPWVSSYPSYPNSFGFKNLGTATTPSTLYLSDNVADGGDVIAVALNGQIVLDNFRIHTPDNEPPHPLSLVLNQGGNRIDIACRRDPDDGGCTLEAELSDSIAGAGITTVNTSPIPEGQYATFVVEYNSNR